MNILCILTNFLLIAISFNISQANFVPSVDGSSLTNVRQQLLKDAHNPAYITQNLDITKKPFLSTKNLFDSIMKLFDRAIESIKVAKAYYRYD
jgi:hypothetical protein